MTTHVGLLRGINVGGKNPISMVDLKACFEQHGFEDVTTYIQSGNVLFDSPERSAPRLARSIEAMLVAGFGCNTGVVLRTRSQLQRIVQDAPEGFGTRPAQYRYDVVYLKPPLREGTALTSVRPKAGVDEATAGTGVLYFSRLIQRASQSGLSRLAALPVYQSMTIRNWNTTTRLQQMMRDGP